MPLVSAVCPHCEHAVQFQVTHVTRSRPCPECGNVVMLQVAEKSNRVKRKALLMETFAEADETDSSGNSSELPYEPKPLTGEAFDRMKMDPEIQKMRGRLVMGGIVVLGMVVLAAVVHLTGVLEGVTAKKEFEEKFGEVEAPRAAGDEEAFGFPLPEQKLEAEEPTPAPVSGRLVFSGLDRGGEAKGSLNKGQKKAEPFGDQRLVLENFLKAPSLDQRASWVAERVQVEPLMKKYYAERGDLPVNYSRIGKSSSAGPGATDHQVVLNSGEIRVATVLETPEGYRVDWPSFVALGEMEWRDFLGAKPVTPILLRVHASPGGRFENQFGDPSWLRCVNLTHIDDPSGGIVFGYVEKSSDLGRRLEYWLELSGGQPIPLTLRLKFPQDSYSDRQVWITELVSDTWVIDSKARGVTQR